MQESANMPNRINESHIEEAALAWLRDLHYSVIFGPEIAPGEARAERANYHEYILQQRLNHAIRKLNPSIPSEALDDAFRKVTIPSSPSLAINNRNFHKMLVEGVDVEYQRPDGTIAGDRVRLADFENPENNDWLAVNQFTVVEGQHNRRPDIVLFLNGLPIIVIELKNPADENATLRSAFSQFSTYKHQIPSFFAYNEMLIISDGLGARVGTISANYEWFMRWRTVTGDDLASPALPELGVLIKGICNKRRLLDLVSHFIVYEEDANGNVIKKMAGYHQFHAVRKAIETTIAASGPKGNRKCGVVWHTQGSGKSLTMVFYAGQVIRNPAMENPTILVITDRNDLDDQLFGTFSRCHELLRQTPVQVSDRDDLRSKLAIASGGVIFTTIQKFLPEKEEDHYPILSDRRNIIVIADEAHRSQYGFGAKASGTTGEISYGFAKYLHEALPSASFIGFTGTPIEMADKSTRSVFGEYVDIYDVQRAIDDGATVPIYYESRLAKIELKEEERPHLDSNFEEVTEGEEVATRENLKSKWAALEAVVGTETRVSLIARDIVSHFEDRESTMNGKAMIVGMSRRICVDLYNAIIRLRPEWHNDSDMEGVIKVVMTGSATDPVDWQPHIRNKQRREKLATRFKNCEDSFKIAIVRDMWLTGFDVPCLHTMYVDKPMKGHTLMQAIARVNRVYRDKNGGRIVDYLGLAEELKKALRDYTDNQGKGKLYIDQEEAVAVMLEKYEICCGLFHGFDWSGWKSGGHSARLNLINPAMGFVLDLKDGKQRLLQSVTELTKSFALAVPHPEALKIRDEVAFFQVIRAQMVKLTGADGRSPEEIDHAIRQIISKAVSSDEVIDVFAAAGLNNPDISILSDEFLSDVRSLPQKNLAVEMLRKLLNDEIKARSRKNVVQSRLFSEMLEATIKKYQNRAIQTAMVIEELIQLAKQMREAAERGENLGLSEAELAFYDALAVNDSAVQVLGDETLKLIAQDLVRTVKQNVTIDWTVRESVQAKLRAMIKRILRKYNYPPDKQEEATLTVLKQAELHCKEITAVV